MGQSWSSGRRSNRRHNRNPSQPQPPPSSSESPPVALPAPLTPSPRPQSMPPQRQTQPSYAFAASTPYPVHQQPPQSQNVCPVLPTPSPPPLFLHLHRSSAYNYARPAMGLSSYNPYYINHSNTSPGFRPPAPPSHLTQPPPLYVDHQSAKKIKNDVNVRKDTIRIEVDEKNPEYHLVSFTFDATVDGSITIFFFGKEGNNCAFTPLYPKIHMPVRIPFQKGLAQKFCQPSGTGIDLGFFDTNDLSKPLQEDVFPLVISAESSPPSQQMDKQFNEATVTAAPQAQITQAVLEKNDDGHFQVKVIMQILLIDGFRYELREIYGISSSNESTNDNDQGKECVICMTEAKDTAVLPCRHMCLCSVCAKEFMLQSSRCPICRQPITELMEIKVNEGN